MIPTQAFPIVVALLAALAASAPAMLARAFPGEDLSSPPYLLGAVAAAMLLQRFVAERRHGPRNYDGMADLLVHVHSPASPDSASRWGARALISLALSAFGGVAGPEGAAVEGGHALALRGRAGSARWFEQRRRTEASCAVAAGIGAAFGAPFAALLLPIEIGLGGRVTSIATSALLASVAAKYLALASGAPVVPGLGGAALDFRFARVEDWVSVALVAVACGAAAAIAIRVIRYLQDGMLDLFRTRAWMRALTGGALLALVVVAHRSGHVSWPRLLSDRTLDPSAIGLAWSPAQAWLGVASRVLVLGILLGGFGSVGVFWPVFAIGGLVAYGLQATAFPEATGALAAITLVGGAAFWAATVGAPLAGALLAVELTGSFQYLLPALLAGVVAARIRARSRTGTLFESDLAARGMELLEGRSLSVLEAVLVRDAMVSDHEVVHEHEPVSELNARLLRSRYPFLPVVNTQGAFRGLLTIDLVQEAWHGRAERVDAGSPGRIARVLEARDLLYGSSLRTATAKATDRLSTVAILQRSQPCIPVLGEDGRVLGLLLGYHVRLAYDREMARRSLSPGEADGAS